ncbi:MAG TPA: hypothetical protein VIA18_12125 [Polyangia bacterium]|jgi:hypothetical protein|nr:hypothetical protein [Polyangia bacterium]HWE27364.1 hypothetical protein [Polyangia bacterium]
MRQTMIALCLVFLGAPTARAGETKCGVHQHEAVEQNDDEGGTVKRCVCDEGWDANGPGAPCKKVKADKPKKK